MCGDVFIHANLYHMVKKKAFMETCKYLEELAPEKGTTRRELTENTGEFDGSGDNNDYLDNYQ